MPTEPPYYAGVWETVIYDSFLDHLPTYHGKTILPVGGVGRFEVYYRLDNGGAARLPAATFEVVNAAGAVATRSDAGALTVYGVAPGQATIRSLVRSEDGTITSEVRIEVIAPQSDLKLLALANPADPIRADRMMAFPIFAYGVSELAPFDDFVLTPPYAVDTYVVDRSQRARLGAQILWQYTAPDSEYKGTYYGTVHPQDLQHAVTSLDFHGPEIPNVTIAGLIPQIVLSGFPLEDVSNN